MAEAIQGQGGAPQGGAPAAGQPAGGAQPQGGAPAAGQPAGQPSGGSPAAQPQYPWQSDQRWRDKGPDDIYKAYQGLEQKLGTHAQLEQFAQQINAFAQQYGGLEQLAQMAQVGRQFYEQQQRGGQQQQQQQPQNTFERWDLMTPQEQAQAMQQAVLNQFTPIAQQYAESLRQQLQNEVQNQLGGVQRQWDIFNRVLTKKLDNPSLNVQEVLQQMVNMASRGADPNFLMETALNNMTFQQQIEQKANEIAQARIADYEQKQKNASLSALTAVRPAGPAPDTNATPRTAEDRKRQILQTLLTKGQIAPDQI